MTFVTTCSTCGNKNVRLYKDDLEGKKVVQCGECPKKQTKEKEK